MTWQEKWEVWKALPTLDKALHDEVSAMSDSDAREAFWGDLAFGTGGLRGELGAGTGRMNVYTVAKATRGLGAYLKAQFEQPSCAVSFDSRIMSTEFARLTAAVLAEMGITVYLYPRLMPTPMLSFAVRHHHCSGGVMVTASHNPSKFNGYKVYGPDGCQITEEAAAAIEASIGREPDLVDALPSCEAGLASGKIIMIGEDTVQAYYAMLAPLHLQPTATDLKIVYSPLNGTGNEPVREMLKRMGKVEVIVVPEQEHPDGHFPTCSYPNPEMPEAMKLSGELAVKTNADFCMATDPDCDRVGVGVVENGKLTLMTGNETGCLLLDYLCRFKKSAFAFKDAPVAVKTIVSTDMAGAICKKYGVELREVLTGFKYIGEQIGLLEKDGEAGRYLLGFEESYGYLTGTSVRDKDAVDASQMICEMAAWHKSEGRSLLDAMRGLYNEFGWYRQRLLSFTFEGIAGKETMASLMAHLRKPDLTTLGGETIEKRIDYANDATGLPQSDVLSFLLTGGRKVIVRPSGTEPKLKAYLFASGTDLADGDGKLDVMEAAVRSLVPKA